MQKILEVKNIDKSFVRKNGLFKKETKDKILKNVSFTLEKGKILGLVGESGCGKSTVSNVIVKLIEPDSGEVYFNGENILNIKEKDFRHMRPKIQLISQNPYKAFNPKLNVEELMLDGLLEHFDNTKEELIHKCEEMLEKCGLPKDTMQRYPHEFSGGQLQRISIARTLCMEPELVIADEIVSALDMSTQAEILDLLLKLKKENNLSIIFISHDLGVIRKICDEIVVMKKGEIVDMGDKFHIFHESENEYTKKLVSAIPIFEY